MTTTIQNKSDIKTITDLSASEIAKRIKNGELSVKEVVETHISHIQEVNQKINAVVIPLFKEALKEAERVDRERRNGQLFGPLVGVPVTIKEQYRVSGTETTLGVYSQRGKKYDSEGPLVKKLREAGAIIVGKTNIAQTLIGWESDNPIYGQTNNPWDLARTPGGSSGGESAIIAAKGVPLGLGGDLGGSIRIPAHFCGINGLKPTSGRLTNEDVPEHLFNNGQEAIIAQPGPMARSVEDLNLAMEVLTSDPLKETIDLVPPVSWPDPAKINVEKLRIGVFTSNGFFSVSPAIRRAVEEASDFLSETGAEVETFTPLDADEALSLFLGIFSVDGGDSVKRLLAGEKPIEAIKGNLTGMSMPNLLRPAISKLMELRGQDHLAFIIRSAGRSSASKYWQYVKNLNNYRKRFIDALNKSKLDAVICPPFALPAVTHKSSEHLFAAGTYSFIFNLLGMPAGVVAATRVKKGEETNRTDSRDLTDRVAKEVEKNSSGLPVGVQVAARHWREDIVLAVMSALEKHFQKNTLYPDFKES